MRDLGTLGDADSKAFGINNAGQVVGESTPVGDSYTRAFITGPNGAGMRALDNEVDSSYISSAYGINDAGQAVGLFGSPRVPGAFITGPNGVGMRYLGSLGGPTSYASSINNAGQVVGRADASGGGRHAFITGPNGVGIRDLGTLGAAVSEASGINNAGQVVGDLFFPDRQYSYHAFITGPNGADMKDLGTLGGTDSHSYGINDAGQAVGESESGAFITGPNGAGMMDLNSLVNVPNGGSLRAATGINNAGQIIALGFIPAVPEPEISALFIAGLALVGFMARRKKRTAPTLV